MSFFKRIFSTGAKDVADAAGSLAIDIREAIKGKEADPNKLIEFESKILDFKQRQIDLNIQESKSNSIFVAGWRPFVGWVCGFALLYNYIIRNFIEYALSVFSPDTPFPPHLSMTELLTLLTGMLGFGYLRTKEKKEGTSK